MEGPQQKFPNDEQCRRGTPWEGLLLNLSSNCESRRVALPAPRLEQSREEPPSGRAVESPSTPCRRSAGSFFLGSRFLLSHSCGMKGWCAHRRAWGRMAWVFCGPLLVSSTGDAGCTEIVSRMSKCRLM